MNFRETNGQIGDRKGWWRIGDFLIDSDYIPARLEEETSEIILLCEGKVLGKGMPIFLEALSEGKFGFFHDVT